MNQTNLASFPLPTPFEQQHDQHQFDAQYALARHLATGSTSATYWANHPHNVAHLRQICEPLSTAFLAKAAVYAQQQQQTSLAVLLLAMLSCRSDNHADFKLAFAQVIDDVVQLCDFAGVLRSGVVGRQSLGSLPKKLINQWLLSASDQQLLCAPLGMSPSLVDVLRMTHPKPQEASREALFGYLLNKPHQPDALPPLVQQLRQFALQPNQKRSPQHWSTLMTVLPYQILSPLEARAWAERADGLQLCQHLNLLVQNGLLNDADLCQQISQRVQHLNEDEVSQIQPYALLRLYARHKAQLPHLLGQALEHTIDRSLHSGLGTCSQVVVAVDISGSMRAPIDGFSPQGDLNLRCIDVAALLAATLKRNNPNTRLLPFDHQVHVDRRAKPLWYRRKEQVSCFDLAQQWSQQGGGHGVSMLPIRHLNHELSEVDVMIMVSDRGLFSQPTSPQQPEHPAQHLYAEWQHLKRRLPHARLVCIDLQAEPSDPQVLHDDVLYVGGFSDAVLTWLSRLCQQPTHTQQCLYDLHHLELEKKIA